jgi:hypothetical protein
MAMLKSRRPSSLLCLALEGRQLEGVVLNRTNSSFKVVRTLRAALSLDPLTNDAELVGREIRNHLDEEQIRENRCAMCIPLSWALTLQVKLPAIPDADVASFLQLEAERGFPYAPADLSMASSRFSTAAGDKFALLVAVPKTHLTTLEKVLKAARLKPLSFSLAITSLQDVKEMTETGQLTLSLGEANVELQVCAGGGVAALRALEGAYEAEGTEKRVDSSLIAREIRITLGQLPKELREMIRRIEVFGPTELTGPLIKAMSSVARDTGLLMGEGSVPQTDGITVKGSGLGAARAALCLGTRILAGEPPRFEFLPPKLSPWAQVTSRFSSAKIVYTGAAAGLIVLLVIGAFGYQQWQLSSLDAKYKAIHSRVDEVDKMQQQTRKFRSWYDETVKSLRILRKVTEAFPEDGAVTAKTVEIKDLSEVTCAGQARDAQGMTDLQGRLGKVPQITGLKVPDITGGKSPMKFNLSFTWNEGNKQ